MSELSVLVVSCDHYSDLWLPFFSLFWKYWPDCPYQVYLGANQLTYDDQRVTTVLTRDDPSWAESTRRMVQRVPSDYLLVLLEDFLFRDSVATGEIEQCFQSLRALGGGYLRLKPFPKPDRSVSGHPWIGEIKPGAPYRAALQAAIWRKDVLLSLLVDGETAWDMEVLGSRRSDALPESFYSVWKPVLEYRAGITYGKWVPFAVRICQKEAVPVDLAARSVMSTQEVWWWRLRVMWARLIDLIPWQRRRPVGDLMRRLKLLPLRADDEVHA